MATVSFLSAPIKYRDLNPEIQVFLMKICRGNVDHMNPGLLQKENKSVSKNLTSENVCAALAKTQRNDS